MDAEISNLTPFRLGVGLVREAVCLLGLLCKLWRMFLNTPRFSKNIYSNNTDLFFGMCFVARQQRKIAKASNFKP